MSSRTAWTHITLSQITKVTYKQKQSLATSTDRKDLTSQFTSSTQRSTEFRTNGASREMEAWPRRQYSQDLAELVELLQCLSAPALLFVTAAACAQRALQESVVPAAGIPAV